MAEYVLNCVFPTTALLPLFPIQYPWAPKHDVPDEQCSVSRLRDAELFQPRGLQPVSPPNAAELSAAACARRKCGQPKQKMKI